MTNGDYFRQADDNTLAELLTTLCVNILAQVGVDATEQQIEDEKNSFIEYLKEETVKGDYLN